MNASPSIQEIHNQYLSHELTFESMVGSCFKKIETGGLNTYISKNKDRAILRAKELQDQFEKEGGRLLSSKPLLGIPVGIKDALHVEGFRTTCASKILENYFPPFTATCVQRLEEAGAIVLGKTNMDEFAMGSSNENSAFGDVIHPTHADRVPGGSSGGSAATVGAGECPISLGSDTGGSIRLPASFCGVVGFKPTYGRVSRFGLVAFASSLDQVGPFARTVADAARVSRVMMGFDENDMTTAQRELPDFTAEMKTKISGKKIGLPKEFFQEGLDPAVKSKIQAAIDWFKDQGAKIVEVDLPHAQYAIATYYIIANCEASSNLSRYDGVRYGARPDGLSESDLNKFYREVRSQFGSEVKRRILLGTFALSSGYYDAYYRRACQVRRLIKNDFDHVFKKVDVLMGPVSPGVAFKKGERVNDPLKMYLEDIYTVPVSLAGLPAISVPCGKDQDGLPVGLQIIAPAFEDARVLSFANAFEQAQKDGDVNE